jgi:hypothetical protein
MNHRKASDLNLKNSAHVDRHNEQESMPDQGMAVPGRKINAKFSKSAMPAKELQHNTDVLPPAHHRGAGSGITSDTQSIGHDIRGGGANAISSPKH